MMCFAVGLVKSWFWSLWENLLRVMMLAYPVLVAMKSSGYKRGEAPRVEIGQVETPPSS